MKRPKRYIVVKNAQHGLRKIREPWQVIDTTTSDIVGEYSSGRMARGAAAHYNYIPNGKPANFRYGLKADDPILRKSFLIAPESLQSWWREAWDKFAGAGTGGGPGR